LTIIEKKQTLMFALRGYERWVAGGKLRYGYRDGEQHVHDNYHSNISPVDGQPGVYDFYIQVGDSPMGDTWWRGRFRSINDGTDVVILEEGSKWR
jgi:hypothetical protein